MRKTLLACALSLPAAAGASVSSTAGSGPTGLSAELEVAWSRIEGNSESTSQMIRGEVVRDGVAWRHLLEAEGVNAKATEEGSDESVRTAERYFGAYKIDRKLGTSKENYLFNVFTYEKDNFSGYQYQASYALGIGRQWMNTERQTLDTELGPGYQVFCLEPETGYSDCADREESPILRVALRYRLALSQSATFREQASAEVTDNQVVSRLETSLTSMLNDRLALRVLHLLKHNSAPAAGKKKTDSELSVSLVYTF